MSAILRVCLAAAAVYALVRLYDALQDRYLFYAFAVASMLVASSVSELALAARRVWRPFVVALAFAVPPFAEIMLAQWPRPEFVGYMAGLFTAFGCRALCVGPPRSGRRAIVRFLAGGAAGVAVLCCAVVLTGCPPVALPLSLEAATRLGRSASQSNRRGRQPEGVRTT